MHRLPRPVPGPSGRRRAACHGRLHELPSAARVTVHRPCGVHRLPRGARDEARCERRLEGLPRLPPRPRARVHGEGRVRVVPHAGHAAASGGPRRVRRLPRTPRLRRECQRVHWLPRRQAHPGGRRGPGARRLHQLPRPAQSRRGRERVRGVPPGGAGVSRNRRRVRDLPHAARRRTDRPGRALHQLPRQGRRLRHRRAQGRHRLRVVPQGARLRGPRRKDHVPRLPRSRDRARRLEPGSRGLHRVPRSDGGARDRTAGGLRHLPRRRAEVRSRRPPAVRGVPRAARRAAHARVRDVPREQGRRAAHDDPGRLRDLPSRARPRRRRRAARLQDLPRSGQPARSSRGSGSMPGARAATVMPTNGPAPIARDAPEVAMPTGATTNLAPRSARGATCFDEVAVLRATSGGRRTENAQCSRAR